MHEKILKKAGLTDVQAEVYSFLLENGEFKASEIAKKIKRPRGVVYKGLDDLTLLKLIQKIENKGITRFKADHPGNLERILEAKEKQAIREINDKKNRLETDKKSVLSTLPDLVSVFNLTNEKPGIKFYEGEEGIITVINDTLKSKEVVYTYADIEAINKYIKKINDDYTKKRNELNIQKKILFTDTPFSREYLKTYNPKVTKIGLIKSDKIFTSIMQIYDNKISYITLTEKNKIGVIIEDKNIYEMHRMIFESMWENSYKIENQDSSLDTSKQ